MSDLDAAFRNNAKVRLWFILGELWKAIGQQFLDEPRLDFKQRQHRECYPDQHEEHVNFLRLVVPRYLRILRSKSLVAGNFTYWMVHDIGAVLEGSGHRLVVVHKEGLVSAWPSVAAEYAQRVATGVGATTAERIGVHAIATKNLIAGCGVAPENRITVTGAVRLDSCHSSRKELSEMLPQCFRRITFWPSVGVRLGLKSAGNAEPEPLPDWAQTLEMALDVALRLAVARPDAEAIIKSKGWVSRLPTVAPMLDQLAHAGQRNLVVRSVGEGQNLLLASDAIVALNSTVIFEVTAAGTPVLVPGFEFSRDPRMRYYALELGSTVEYAATADDLLGPLQVRLDSPPLVRSAELTAEEQSVLERYTGNADGAAAERLSTFLGVELPESQLP